MSEEIDKIAPKKAIQILSKMSMYASPAESGYDQGHSETSVETLNQLYMQYLGVLGLLAELSVYLPDNCEDDREVIERALDDAVHLGLPLKWKRVLNRIDLGVVS